MSWKLRRKRIEKLSRKQALVIRKFFIASLSCSVIGLLLVFIYPPLAPVFAIPWFISVAATPMFCMASASGMWQVSPKRRAELDEEVWDKWVSDAEKKENKRKAELDEEIWNKWVSDAEKEKEISEINPEETWKKWIKDANK